MFYCKENLYAEFDVATQKDTKGKKEKLQVYTWDSSSI